jgi:glycosyltransferase involved in cell wall biosynthesis
MEPTKALAGKHILLIVENQSVPFDRRMWNIARSLSAFGAEVSAVCPISDTDPEPSVDVEGIHIHRYPAAFSPGSVAGYVREYTVAFVRTIRLTYRLLRRHRIDAVHVANPPDIFWPLAIALRFRRVKFVFDEHDLSPEAFLSRFEREEKAGGIILWMLRLMQRLTYRYADMIISTNESYRERASEVDSRNASKTFVVRNGPDTRRFHLHDRQPALRRGHKFLAAYIGVMAIQDGVEYVLRAVDEIVNRRGNRDILFYLIGKGDDWPRLKQMALELGLQDDIVFTGRIPDAEALDILSTADVCLSPDPASPLNELSTMTKIMEYMALGKPIVSFLLKENSYSAGSSAIYVENNNPVAFAEGILTLLGDSARSRRMGEDAMARVANELSWERQAERLREAYLHLFNG